MFVSFAVILRFSMIRYTVNEAGPAIQICVDLVEGSIESIGETVNVASIGGGTAIGKTFANRVSSEWEKSRESHSFKPHNLDMKCIVLPPFPKSSGFCKIPFQAKNSR